MKNILELTKGSLALAVIFTLLVCGTPAAAQDLVAVSDITGGSSVFVFRTSARSAPKKFVSKARTTRTKTQRIETAKKVTKQYSTLAKVEPRRTRTETVDPFDPRLKKIQTMPKEEASRLFAGVGEYYMDRDDFNNAVDFFREAATMDAKNARAANGLSEALALMGNDLLVKDSAAAARKFFEEALKYNPKNAPAYFGLGEVFTGLDDDAKAVENYEKALANDAALTEIYTPLGILYYQQGEIAKADTLLTKAMAISPDDAQTQYFLGLIRYSQNRNDEALTAFQKAKTLDPNLAEAYHYTGETMSRSDKNNAAIAEYEKAVTLKPAYFEAWLGLGAAYYETKNYPKAIEAYKRAVRLKNDNIQAYENLADAQRENGDFSGAEASYNLAATFIERSKDLSKEQAADIYSKAGFMVAKQCEKKAASCKWDRAVVHLEKAVGYSQSSVDQANLGWAYYNAARADITYQRLAEARPKLEKARTNLQKAVSSNAKFVAAPLLNLGLALRDLGDYAGAEDALKKVLQKEPGWGFALNELGSVYRSQNKYKEAAAQFRKAADKEEKNAIVQFNWGEAEYQSGNIGEAKKAYAKLKKMGRNDLADRLTAISGGKVRG